jgi:hypothetical protein
MVSLPWQRVFKRRRHPHVRGRRSIAPGRVPRLHDSMVGVRGRKAPQCITDVHRLRRLNPPRIIRHHAAEGADKLAPRDGLEQLQRTSPRASCDCRTRSLPIRSVTRRARTLTRFNSHGEMGSEAIGLRRSRRLMSQRLDVSRSTVVSRFLQSPARIRSHHPRRWRNGRDPRGRPPSVLTASDRPQSISRERS